MKNLGRAQLDRIFLSRLVGAFELIRCEDDVRARLGSDTWRTARYEKASGDFCHSTGLDGLAGRPIITSLLVWRTRDPDRWETFPIQSIH